MCTCLQSLNVAESKSLWQRCYRRAGATPIMGVSACCYEIVFIYVPDGFGLVSPGHLGCTYVLRVDDQLAYRILVCCAVCGLAVAWMHLTPQVAITVL